MPTSSRAKTGAACKSAAAKKPDAAKTTPRHRAVRRKVDAADRDKPKPKAP
ncbi:MAG: hypothetical protein J0H31_02490 [Alphaproteobacteria bacterium]|nr:hypothetical protein [Alphaproteobacteria bacterium]